MFGVSFSHKGSCRCGGIEFEVTGAPDLVMACHCKGCQKMTGGPYSLSALFPGERFALTKGETVLGGLKKELDHRFCPDCMSWVFTQLTRFGNYVNIRTSMLNDAAAFVPFIESYTSEKLPFAESGAVHSYEKFPEAEEYPQLMAEFAQTLK